MPEILTSVLAPFALGAFFWTFMEYVLHRFAFHERRGANYGSREHLRHHAKRDYTVDTQVLAWVGVLIVGLGVLNVGARLLFGPLVGWSFGIGFVVGYFTYEWLHAAAHLWAPRTSYGHWLRRHHFHHHFAEPLRNHGVTIPLWDHVFGTYSPSDTVTVPRRLAMRWLLDEAGDVREGHRGEYRVRGRRTDLASDEADRAFANLPPVLDDGPAAPAEVPVGTR
ncbi:MAG: sterol desaturase family protein [Actinomycetota bacterium]